MPDVDSRNAPTSQSRYLCSAARSGNNSRSAGSSTWMIWAPALSRSIVSSRIGEGDLIGGLGERLVVAHERPRRIVTGPVSMPLTGLS